MAERETHNLARGVDHRELRQEHFIVGFLRRKRRRSYARNRNAHLPPDRLEFPQSATRAETLGTTLRWGSVGLHLALNHRTAESSLDPAIVDVDKHNGGDFRCSRNRVHQ